MHRFSTHRFPVLLMLSLALIMPVAGCGQPSVQIKTAPASPAIKPPKTSSQSEKTGDPLVTISDSQFHPAELKVEAGTKVVWTNNDSVDHQVHDDGDAFQGEVLAGGGKTEFEYTSPGRFPYHCHLHPGMKGIIIVE